MCPADINRDVALLESCSGNLGIMYYYGDGVPQDLVEAYMWLTLAAAQGAEYASSVLDKLGAEMTFMDKFKAKRRARQWLETHGKAE